MFWWFLVGLVIGLIIGGCVIYFVMNFEFTEIVKDNNFIIFDGKIYSKKGDEIK